eukprot:s8179_g1.t1
MPRMAREWHPIEEFTALMSVMMKETDRSLSYKDRLLSTGRLHGDSSEGFQGCLQLWFGPSTQIVGGKHLEYFYFIEAKALASCGRRRRIRRVVTHAKYAQALDCFLLFALIEKRHDMNPWRLQVPILGGP